MFNMSKVSFVVLILAAVPFGRISGHGYLADPISRGSLWRIDSSATRNDKDDANLCGGGVVQHIQNGGKCGLCGDPYNEAQPRANENTGKFGKGKVVRTYTSGSVIDVTMNITRSHKGKVEFSICKLKNRSAPEPGESCFKALDFGSGGKVFDLGAYNPTAGAKFVLTTQVKLPSGLRCSRCVLRWQYTTDNPEGVCADGTQAAGCAGQDTFRNCADIAIH